LTLATSTFAIIYFGLRFLVFHTVTAFSEFCFALLVSDTTSAGGIQFPAFVNTIAIFIAMAIINCDWCFSSGTVMSVSTLGILLAYLSSFALNFFVKQLLLAEFANAFVSAFVCFSLREFVVHAVTVFFAVIVAPATRTTIGEVPILINTVFFTVAIVDIFLQIPWKKVSAVLAFAAIRILQTVSVWTEVTAKFSSSFIGPFHNGLSISLSHVLDTFVDLVQKLFFAELVSAFVLTHIGFCLWFFLIVHAVAIAITICIAGAACSSFVECAVIIHTINLAVTIINVLF
jgi:hypothetical protein